MVFRLILALDILDGMVVHAVKGERDRYTPIHTFSSIVKSSDPSTLIQQVMPKEAYIADINRLTGRGDNRAHIKKISKFCRTMLDWGVRDSRDVKTALKIADNVILGTETSSFELIEIHSNFKMNVSIDIKNGSVLSPENLRDPLKLVRRLNDYDIGDLIILEMDRIGTKSGVDTEFISGVVDLSDHDIILGGGVRSCDGIDELKRIGVKGAIISTAVHDGSIPVEMIR
jgi:phosphoribosylformimino-5-aminoimidazole carboxamide ribotide isomerase